MVSVGESLFNVTSKFLPDERVLYAMWMDDVFDNKKPTLNIQHLEKRKRFPAFPVEPVSQKKIKKRLGAYRKEIEGTTFETQLEGLLPAYLDSYEHPEELRMIASYFIKRMFVGKIPKGLSWLLYQNDLDSISATLFLLESISKIIGHSFSWLDVFLNPNVMQFPTNLPRLAPRCDSVFLDFEPAFIGRAFSEIGIAGFKPLQKVYRKLNRRKYPSNPTLANFAKIIGSGKTRTRYATQLIDLTLTEHIIPVPHIMGLRHRWALARRIRNFDKSLGLVERYECRKFDDIMEDRRRYKEGSFERHHFDPTPDDLELIEKLGLDSFWKTTRIRLEREVMKKRTDDEKADIDKLKNLERRIKTIITKEMKENFKIYLNMRCVTHHLEPSTSEGPILQLEAFDHFTTEHEEISYRVDMYDPKERDWQFKPWTRSSPEEESNWIHYDSSLIKSKQYIPSEKELFVMGSYALNRASPRYRRRTQVLLGLDSRDVNEITKRLIDRAVLKFLYYPSLKYAGLSEGVMIVIPKMPTRPLNSFRKWILEIAPYAHIYWKKGGSMVANVVVPTGRAGLLMAVMNNEIRRKWSKYTIHMSSIQDMFTYYFTMPNKLYDKESKCWFDPWFVK